MPCVNTINLQSLMDCMCDKDLVLCTEVATAEVQQADNEIHETCHGITSYFTKNSFSEINWECFLPINIGEELS